MPGIGLELPTIQNWSCHSCSGCCRQHGIVVTDAEKERIEQQGWTEVDGIPAGQPLFVQMGGVFEKTWWRLAHQPDGGCAFLNEEGLCRIHAKFGEDAKPLACRIYPYAFHPAGQTVAVSLRFSCPSVTKNLGRPVVDQVPELRKIAHQIVPENFADVPPASVSPGQSVDWSDFRRFVRALDETVAAGDSPFVVRLVRALSWMGLVAQSRFDSVLGARLGEFLDLVVQSAREDVPDSVCGLVATAGEPSRIGRTQFRLLAGQYARKDTYASMDGTWRGRLRLLQTALRLSRGAGNVPIIQERFREVPFERLEQPFGDVPDGVDEIFTRYYRVKIRGMAFCGRAYYDVPLVEGFYSLALVYPAVLWIARWLAASDDRNEVVTSDVVEALCIADHHHGYSPAFGTWGFRRRVRTLGQLGDIAKLAVWYSR